MRKKGLLLAVFFASALAILFAWHFKFFPFKAPFARIPVKFSSSFTPCAEIEIEKEKYFLIVDSGADSELSIKTEVLDRIEKKLLGQTHWQDIKGNEYESSRYQIPEIKMGKVQIKNAKAHDGYTEEKGHLWGNRKKSEFEISGTIGINLLGISRHLLLDFYNSEFFIFRKREDLKHFRKEGYLLENLVEIPFEGDNNRIIFQIDTDEGQKKFLLDTGASISMIRPVFISAEERDAMQHSTLIITFSKFMISGHDFGETDLYAYNVPEKFEDIDGILGMDFCKKHVIYLDFKEKKALIGAVEKVHPVSK